jgi:hypothetical protein
LAQVRLLKVSVPLEAMSDHIPRHHLQCCAAGCRQHGLVFEDPGRRA